LAGNARSEGILFGKPNSEGAAKAAKNAIKG
jgi:hypothetical protein